MLIHEVRLNIYLHANRYGKSEETITRFDIFDYLLWCDQNLKQAAREGAEFVHVMDRAKADREGFRVGIIVTKQKAFNVWLAERYEYDMTPKEESAIWGENLAKEPMGGNANASFYF